MAQASHYWDEIDTKQKTPSKLMVGVCSSREVMKP